MQISWHSSQRLL